MASSQIVVLLNQFYPPDIAPTGIKLHELAKAFRHQGRRVMVLASSGSYNGDQRFKSSFIDGVEVVRLPASCFGRKSPLLKLSDYATYYVSVWLKLLRLRRHVGLVVGLTTPPYLGLIPALMFGRKENPTDSRISRNGTVVAQWVMDLYPDVMSAYGIVGRGSIVYRVLGWLNRIMFRRSDVILALGPCMAEAVGAYLRANPVEEGVGPISGAGQVQWVALWADAGTEPATEEQRKRVRSEYGWAESDFVVMHAGNVGPGTRIDEFLAAAGRTGDTGPIWAFFGGGNRWPALEAAVKGNPKLRVQLRPYAARTVLQGADVHLVSLASDWTGVGVPSKIQNIFAIAKPAIYVGGLDSESAMWVRDSGAGWVVAEGDVDGLVRAVEEAKNPQERARRGALALEYARKHFDVTENCRRLVLAMMGNPPSSSQESASGDPRERSRDEGQRRSGGLTVRPSDRLTV